MAVAGELESRHRLRLREPPSTPMDAISSPANNTHEEDEDVVADHRTHHRRASRRAIRAIHHEEDDAHIPDLLRSQADVDHSGHTRRVFLARHQQIQLNPAPIVAHFRSKPSHLSIHIFMDHSTDFNPRMGHHSSGTERFLPELIRPSNLPKLAVFVSIISKAWISRSRPFIDAAHGPLHSMHSPPAVERPSLPPPRPRPRPSLPPPRPRRLPSRRPCVCLHRLSHRLPAARRSLPLHRHHLPAARTVHQLSRLHDLSRQQPGKHASG
ncbi:hypothetical protein ACLOJK_040857 [Asimina triloba]